MVLMSSSMSLLILLRVRFVLHIPHKTIEQRERKRERRRRLSAVFKEPSREDKRALRIALRMGGLHLIGLGLGNEKDITVNALEAIRDKCAHVYLENYTSVLAASPSKLEEFYGKKVTICDRAFVESNGVDGMLTQAEKEDVAFLVVGDCFAATTHSDLVLRAHEKKVKVKTYYNASIMNACAGSGLQLYNFGENGFLMFLHANVETGFVLRFDQDEQSKRRFAHARVAGYSGERTDGGGVVHGEEDLRTGEVYEREHRGETDVVRGKRSEEGRGVRRRFHRGRHGESRSRGRAVHQLYAERDVSSERRRAVALFDFSRNGSSRVGGEHVETLPSETGGFLSGRRRAGKSIFRRRSVVERA